MGKRNIESIVNDRVSLLAKCKKENKVFFKHFKYEIGDNYFSSIREDVCIEIELAMSDKDYSDVFKRLFLEVRSVSADVVELGEVIIEYGKSKKSLEEYLRADLVLKREVAVTSV